MQVNSLIGNIGTTYSGIVTGAELESVSKEIFGVASGETAKVTFSPKSQEAAQPQQQTQTSAFEEINLYSRRTDIDLSRQIAQNNSSYNMQLSQSALQNIQALNQLAITNQLNTQKLVDGKVIIPMDETGKETELKERKLGYDPAIVKIYPFEKDNPFLSDNTTYINNASSKLA
jgi:hypothetical protein